MIDITMDMEQYDCPFIDVTDDTDVTFSAVHWEFDTATEQLETRMVVEAGDRSALSQGLDALGAHAEMVSYTLLSKRQNVAHIRTTITQTSAMAAIRENDGYITGPFYIEDGSELWHIGFDERDRADSALYALDDTNDFSVVDRQEAEYPELQGFVQNAGAAMTLIEGCRGLSAVERKTLERAVQGGYFQSPRSATLGSLAEEFDVSKPAVSKNLRRSQRKVIQRVVDVLEELE
ncbi:helix-turn-helix domain-containing protein [Halocatena halophila]|uniref:helix-turn-helix domain-containing protein n=1 Tax=Halocatena halophila TaxID=2814576 RepID=UPI002ED44F42